MRIRRAVAGVVVAAGVAGVAITTGGCRRGAPAPRREAEMAVTPADAYPARRVDRRGGEGALRAGWARFEQRKSIRLGETVRVGPEPYATVRLVEVGEGVRSVVFEAAHLVDRRRGRVGVGQYFSEFTPIFGSKGARLESADAEGATVVFRWAQSAATAVPPGAVRVEGDGGRAGEGGSIRTR